MKKKFPIGIQSFEEIRTGNYYYVDKTFFVAKLAYEGKYYFLSRPRRFGKSLFVDTLKQAFLGRKELFDGLYLEKNWDWSKSYPIIHISFGTGVTRDVSHLEETIDSILRKQEEIYGITLRERLLERRFLELVEKLRTKSGEKVVVLVDEYDKPILDKIEDREKAVGIREVLKNFYSALKDADACIKFLFITGVSKFSKVSLFSGLNQLMDITLNPAYSTLCGYTQEEFEKVFGNELEDLSLEGIWYDGYSFGGEETVYNPFDVLLYLAERRFRPYWFETGTPTFLIKLLVEKNFYIPDLEELRATEKLLGSFDVDFIEPENLLFQTGYLTVKKVKSSIKGMVFHLGYPNKEVRISLNDYIFSYLTGLTSEGERLSEVFERYLEDADVQGIERVFRSLFASIPHDRYVKNELAGYEGYYASVIYSFLQGGGYRVYTEDHTSKGRIDLVLEHFHRCYVMEFKVIEIEGKTPKPLDQIKQRRYYDKYLGKGHEIYLIGMEFSREEKNLVSFEWEKI